MKITKMNVMNVMNEPNVLNAADLRTKGEYEMRVLKAPRILLQSD